MLLPHEVSPLVLAWLNALEVGRQRTGRAALVVLVTAVLVAQSLRPAALMRALLSPRPVPARQRYKRVAHRLNSPWLTPEWLTPVLVRAALTEVAPTPTGPLVGLTHLALDSVRCGRWEIFTLGGLAGTDAAGRPGGPAVPLAPGPVHPDRLSAD